MACILSMQAVCFVHCTHHVTPVSGCCCCTSPAGIHVELSRLLLDKWRWFVGVWSRRYVGARKLDAVMKDWAGVEEEEEAMAAAEAAALAAAVAGSGAGDEDKEPRVLQVSRM